MKVMITGGSGFIGTCLSHHLLNKGHQVIATGTRAEHPSMDREGFTYLKADTRQPGIWQEKVAGCDAVVNLAGRTIFHPWSESYRQQILDSRVQTTRHLVDALPDGREIFFCSASAVGYYGSRGDEPLSESAPPGEDFMAQVALQWEAAAMAAREKGARVVTPRFGVILGHQGGAMLKMVPFYRLLLGGPLGSGRQWFAWMHIDDLLSAIDFLMQHTHMQGPLNFCAPDAIRQGEFARALGRALKRPALMPTPAMLIELMAGKLGEALLASQRVIPAKLLEAGFEFSHPRIDGALAAIVSQLR
jgi:uncharacterized protein (TIGR01777 family)